MKLFCEKEGFGRIEHPELRYAVVYYFLDDGVHLARYGMELYLIQIRKALDAALGVVRYPRRQGPSGGQEAWGSLPEWRFLRG